MFAERIMEDKVFQQRSLPSYLRECDSYLKAGYITKQESVMLKRCFRAYAKEGSTLDVYIMFDSMPIKCQKAFNSIVLKVTCLDRLNQGINRIQRR